jgi:hypothetical protein
MFHSMASENLAFYLEAFDYASIPEDQTMFRRMRSQKIFLRFISPQGRQRVNLPSAIQQELESSEAPYDFEKARHSIFELMERDALPKFLQSQMFQEYKAQNGKC